MNKLSALLIVLCFSMMIISLNAQSQRNRRGRGSKPIVKDSDESYSAVCTSADREAQNCYSNQRARGCLCYNNGTCTTTRVNKCLDCQNLDVFSSLAGDSCPNEQPYLCEAMVPGKRYSCVNDRFDSCVCTKNGTCFTKTTSHCIECYTSGSGSLAVFENLQCPAQYLQRQPSQYFVPKMCEKTDAKSISCMKKTDPGCVCYSNNTCEYRTDSNQCFLCFDRNVVSFNLGEYCPNMRNNRGDLFICGTKGSSKRCSGTENSCVCLSDGTCNMQNTNHCQGCKQRDAVNVIEGGTCPSSSFVQLKATPQKAQTTTPQRSQRTSSRRNN